MQEYSALKVKGKECCFVCYGSEKRISSLAQELNKELQG